MIRTCANCSHFIVTFSDIETHTFTKENVIPDNEQHHTFIGLMVLIHRSCRIGLGTNGANASGQILSLYNFSVVSGQYKNLS